MPENEKPQKLNWERVDKYLQEKSNLGAALALIETEKIFSQVLERLAYPGKNIDEKLERAKPFLPNYKSINTARSIYKKLISELNVEISFKDVQPVLACYYQAVRDLTQASAKNKGIWQRLKLRFYIPKPKRFFKKIAIAFFVFFFIIFLLDTTAFGRGLVKTLVVISHFIFSWVLWTILIIIGLVIVILGALFFFEKRKKRQKIRIEE